MPTDIGLVKRFLVAFQLTLLPREGDKFTIKSARGFEDILHPVLYLGVFKGDLKCFTT